MNMFQFSLCFSFLDLHILGSKLQTIFYVPLYILTAKSIVTYYFSQLLALFSHTELLEPPVAKRLGCPVLEGHMPTPPISTWPTCHWP